MDRGVRKLHRCQDDIRRRVDDIVDHDGEPPPVGRLLFELHLTTDLTIAPATNGSVGFVRFPPENRDGLRRGVELGLKALVEMGERWQLTARSSSLGEDVAGVLDRPDIRCGFLWGGVEPWLGFSVGNLPVTAGPPLAQVDGQTWMPPGGATLQHDGRMVDATGGELVRYPWIDAGFELLERGMVDSALTCVTAGVLLLERQARERSTVPPTPEADRAFALVDAIVHVLIRLSQVQFQGDLQPGDPNGSGNVTRMLDLADRCDDLELEFTRFDDHAGVFVELDEDIVGECRELFIDCRTFLHDLAADLELSTDAIEEAASIAVFSKSAELELDDGERILVLNITSLLVADEDGPLPSGVLLSQRTGEWTRRAWSAAAELRFGEAFRFLAAELIESNLGCHDTGTRDDEISEGILETAATVMGLVDAAGAALRQWISGPPG